tara:strand:- start:539 stop:943 length:405 start_codon:yes stop_codon:yes gene_type:complete
MADQIKIRATVMWAFLDKPNEMSGKFQVDLCELSDKAVQGLEALGIEVKNKEGKGNYITCKSQRPIFAFDDGGSQLNGTIVGNGSKAACLVNTYDWTFKGKKGVGAGIQKLVITDLKEYEGVSAGMDFEEDDIL